MKTTVDTEIRGKRLVIETGRVARQAGGSALVQYGDTVLLAAATAAPSVREGIDFFPLTVDYQEKTYAGGKIPGGFFKREGRPTEREVVTSRLIDRPLRPLFPDGFFAETQIIVTLLSLGEENVWDVLGITAASAALTLSDIPFAGPVASVRMGRVKGRLLVNPSLSEAGQSDIHLVVAGTRDAVVMVEAEADEVPETVLLEAMERGHEEIRRIIGLQEALAEKAGKPKRPFTPPVRDDAVRAEVEQVAGERLRASLRIREKLQRQNALRTLLEETVQRLCSEDITRVRAVEEAFHALEKQELRRMILEEGVRADGRKADEIRPITCEVGVLPRTHGSALFTRGETQALVVATLGTSDDEQKIDALEGEWYKRFYLHYNFPPFCVGEVKPLRSPGRREIGHGALAERALKRMIPSKEAFPYTIRVVSDILESNGSSSMATVCGGTLALMDAGVPIKAPVAGIAMGLIKEGDRVAVLSDIMGLEDHLGDMDFKVTGTAKGVTALQMDNKIGGVSWEVLARALEQAREGRLFILEKMLEAIPAPRAQISAYAPRIFTMQIKPEKIRDVIGTGGKVVRSIVEQTGVKIDVEDSGLIRIAAANEAAAKQAMDIINGIVQEAEVGKIYLGKVKRIVDFGAFVEIFPGTDGLVHISQIADHRVTRVSDELKEGDEVVVKVLEIDKQGKIRLSRKEALREMAARRG